MGCSRRVIKLGCKRIIHVIRALAACSRLGRSLLFVVACMAALSPSTMVDGSQGSGPVNIVVVTLRPMEIQILRKH
jgi:hypothetical protein